MRGYELQDLLCRDWYVRKSFVGIFPSNQLPRKVLKGESRAFVFNTDPHYKRGSHWVALFINSFGDATYFDSFGLPPIQASIKRFILNNSRSLRYNSIPIQSLVSKACGLFCIHFIRVMCRGGTLRDVLSHFNPYSQSFNDRKIKNLVPRSRRF